MMSSTAEKVKQRETQTQPEVNKGLFIELMLVVYGIYLLEKYRLSETRFPRSLRGHLVKLF